MTKRQEDFLKKIIGLYIETGTPVSSQALIKRYKLDYSSATIRNEMNFLEKSDFLEKAHTSSGRIPSTFGYKYYVNHLAKEDDNFFEERLKDVFAKRRMSIDATLDKAAAAISEMAGLTLVTSTHETDELLKSIQLTPINDEVATIVLVTSTGRVESKLFEMNDVVKLDDIRIAIRLFKERLIDTPLRELSARIESLEPILSKSVKNYEAIIQTFMDKIFDFHNKVTNKVYGSNELISNEGIKRKDLAKLVDLMESNSIWTSIEGKMDEDETIKIDIRPNNTSIISKKITSSGISKEVSIVGSNRMNYSQAKQAIEVLEKIIKGAE